MNEQSCANCLFFKADTDEKGNLILDATKKCKYKLPKWAEKARTILKQDPDYDGRFCAVYFQKQ